MPFPTLQVSRRPESLTTESGPKPELKIPTAFPNTQVSRRPESLTTESGPKPELKSPTAFPNTPSFEKI